MSKPFCDTCGTDVAEVLCAKCGKWWRDNSPEVREATARAEAAEAVSDDVHKALWAAEARNKVLEEALRKIATVDEMGLAEYTPQAMVAQARQALGGEHER